MYLTCFVAALTLTFIGSRWIDYLYSMPNSPITFPEKINQRARFRKIILFSTLLPLNIHFARLPLTECFCLSTAAFFLMLITMTDFEQYTIFDLMLLPFAVTGCVAVYQLNFPLTDHLIAMAAGGGAFLLLSIVTGGSIGGGDIKLIAVLGIWLGTDRLFTVVVMGCFLGGIAALLMLLTKLKSRKDYFAYGPYFTLSAIFILGFGI